MPPRDVRHGALLCRMGEYVRERSGSARRRKCSNGVTWRHAVPELPMSRVSHVYRNRAFAAELPPRSAYVVSRQDRVVHGARRYTYRSSRSVIESARLGVTRGRTREATTRAFLCPNIPPMLEAHTGAGRGRVLSRSHRLSSDGSAIILEHSGAGFSSSMGARAAREAAAAVRRARVRVDDTGAPGDPVRGSLAAGSPSPVESCWKDQEEMLRSLHLGHDGRRQGRQFRHTAAGCQRARRSARSQMGFRRAYLGPCPCSTATAGASPGREAVGGSTLPATGRALAHLGG